MENELARIIKSQDIIHRKQKIYNISNNSIYGYESLNRGPKNTKYENPLLLIDEAKEKGLLWQFEKIARIKTFEKTDYIQRGEKIFINVEPELIESNEFSTGFTMDLVQKAGFEPCNIVFEITERAAIKDFNRFIQIIDHYRKQDYQIAIDDVGAGYSGLTKIIRLEPDIIKLDIELIRNIDTHKYKKAIVKGLKTISDDLGILVIAEGIERKEELDTLLHLGIVHGQGYYLHSPEIF